MEMTSQVPELSVNVDLGDDFVATVEFGHPPHNFFNVPLLRWLADVYEELDAEPRCRVILLCSQGRHFCAGSEFSPGAALPGPTAGRNPLYIQAERLFSVRKPVVAEVQGAAVGGGLGLACSADFRVATADSRFAANFARLGFHHGFGLTITLPRIIGPQRAAELLYTGRRLHGDEAARMGLCDRLATSDGLRDEAHHLAAEIAESAPLAVESIRETLRSGLGDALHAALDREDEEQVRLRRTADWREGIRASAERRTPRFVGS